MKKILISAVLLFCTCLQIEAETWTDANGMSWTYNVNGSNATDIKPTDRTIINGAVTIPSTVWNGWTQLKVTSIGSSAFASCTGLSSVVIPEGITAINASAFYGCPFMTSISIPSTVNFIGGEAFYCNYALQKVIVSDIAAWCNINFSGERSNPLSYCHHLYRDANNEITALTIPSGVTAISDLAFIGSTSLTSVSIPSSVTSIGEKAFSGCTALANVDIPNNLTHVGDDAFRDTPFFNNQSGMVYLGKVAYRYAGTMPENTTIDIREGMEVIAQSAFFPSVNLVSVNIPTSVRTIGERAFQTCNGLKNIIIPEGVTTIGNYAFMWSENIESVTLPSTLPVISRSAFKSCLALKRIDIPEGVNTIGMTAFDGCTSLTTVSIPSSVTSIGSYAFDDCDAITSVYNLSTAPQAISSNVFSCYGTATLFVPISSKADYETAEGWKNFHKIVGIHRGDVNGDGIVDIVDVVTLVDHTLGKATTTFVEPAADLNADGDINIEDVVTIVNILLGKDSE